MQVQAQYTPRRRGARRRRRWGRCHRGRGPCIASGRRRRGRARRRRRRRCGQGRSRWGSRRRWRRGGRRARRRNGAALRRLRRRLGGWALPGPGRWWPSPGEWWRLCGGRPVVLRHGRLIEGCGDHESARCGPRDRCGPGDQEWLTLDKTAQEQQEKGNNPGALDEAEARAFFLRLPVGLFSLLLEPPFHLVGYGSHLGDEFFPVGLAHGALPCGACSVVGARVRGSCLGVLDFASIQNRRTDLFFVAI